MFGLALDQSLFCQWLVNYLIRSPATGSQTVLLLISTFTQNLVGDYFIGWNTLQDLSFMKYIYCWLLTYKQTFWKLKTEVV